MPLSIWLGMEDCMQAITERCPRSILDAGMGFGLWGVLFRQYLDVWAGRIQPEQWTTRIDGIELDPARVQAYARHIYSHVYVGDICRLVPQRAAQTTYDVILFGDVLEHLPKSDALCLLEKATHLAGILVVVRLPLGEGWRKIGRESPDHHRSQWSLEDLRRYPAKIRLYDFFGNPYALAIFEAQTCREIDAERILSDLQRRLGVLEKRLSRLLNSGPKRKRRSS